MLPSRYSRTYRTSRTAYLLDSQWGKFDEVAHRQFSQDSASCSHMPQSLSCIAVNCGIRLSSSHLKKCVPTGQVLISLSSRYAPFSQFIDMYQIKTNTYFLKFNLPNQPTKKKILKRFTPETRQTTKIKFAILSISKKTTIFPNCILLE